MSTGVTKLLSRLPEKPIPGGSAIWPIIEHFLNDEFIRLDNAHITPWAFFHSGELKITDFYGKPIAYNGLSFQGSPTLVFWNGYIEPFLQDIASRAIDLVLKAARERNVKTRDPLLEVQGQLYSLIRRAFDRMATIDRNLRCADAHKEVPMQNTDSKQQQVRQFVDRRIEAEFKAMPAASKRWTKLNQWYKDNPIISWAIGISIAIASLLGKLKGLF